MREPVFSLIIIFEKREQKANNKEKPRNFEMAKLAAFPVVCSFFLSRQFPAVCYQLAFSLHFSFIVDPWIRKRFRACLPRHANSKLKKTKWPLYTSNGNYASLLFRYITVMNEIQINEDQAAPEEKNYWSSLLTECQTEFNELRASVQNVHLFTDDLNPSSKLGHMVDKCVNGAWSLLGSGLSAVGSAVGTALENPYVQSTLSVSRRVSA